MLGRRFETKGRRQHAVRVIRRRVTSRTSLLVKNLTPGVNEFLRSGIRVLRWLERHQILTNRKQHFVGVAICDPSLLGRQHLMRTEFHWIRACDKGGIARYIFGSSQSM